MLLLAPAGSQTPVFRSTTNLQSVAVQVVDRKGNFVPGLSANDFTLLEDGRPQKIAFFGGERLPLSLAILLDSSRSMDFGRKFDRAKALLAPLIAGHHPDDEIIVMPFTDRVEAFEPLTPEQRSHPDSIRIQRGSNDKGTALYDAIASAMCRLRTAQNPRQAVVVITDGADQHSRLNLEQLVDVARTSNAQIFTIGFFSAAESRVFRDGRKTVTLVGEREIDNPMLVFERLAKESGAESFFPTSEKDLKTALDRIAEMLQAQYTLAYYPADADRYRKIEVRVHHGGVKVIARSGAGSSGDPIRFETSTCEVSAKDHPYPWELKTTRSAAGSLIYHEDFSDPKSGWPNRHEGMLPVLTPGNPLKTVSEYKPGLRYVDRGYEISHNVSATRAGAGPILDGVVAAYGLPWNNMRASVSVQTDWSRTGQMAAGLVFHLNDTGYYVLLLGGALERGAPFKNIEFKLIRKMFGEDGPGGNVDLIPWTSIQFGAISTEIPANRTVTARTISVDYLDGQIAVSVDGRKVASVHDKVLPAGLAGMAVFGRGKAQFHDLTVQDLP